MRRGGSEAEADPFEWDTAGFPTLFLGDVDCVTSQPLDEKVVRRLLLFGDGRFGRCARLLFYLYDMRQRHELCRASAARFRTRPDEAGRFVEVLNSERFKEALGHPDRADPESRASKYIASRLLPFLATSGCANTAFNPLRRRAAKGEMLAETGLRGVPSWFVTISPADFDFWVTIKLADMSVEPIHLPIRKRMDLTKDNPVAAAENFYILMEAVIEGLIGLPLALGHRETRKTEASGVFGRSHCLYGCIECQGRGALHMHAVLWAGMSPTLLEAIASDPALRKRAAEHLDSVVSTRVPADEIDRG
ncbi:hypothetical protein DIPPA_04784 [Diplonema papillatum]|nr:hypothetical protein DIPPA_00071 [Diplonema papillatum]KAJ9438512.1 hypothetical protein DIPPA_01604 [Diplonema papillatum]KAJ9442319.1 hypothetical protein DIPPA_05882 [Diplonema papillatum]KAJ9448906.1 hypothetical protein DIPPA_04787 [Diplonema papillatum]KAJ9448909.1 hypothetical protein DIPPA_04784 [Diplonema papillatum]